MAPRDSAFERWQHQAAPVLEALSAVLKMAQDGGVQGPDALLATGDQLRAVSSHVSSWLPAHPCPFADVNWLFARMARSYGALAESFDEVADHSTGMDRSGLELETRELTAMLSEAMAMMKDLAGA